MPILSSPSFRIKIRKLSTATQLETFTTDSNPTKPNLSTSKKERKGGKEEKDGRKYERKEEGEREMEGGREES